MNWFPMLWPMAAAASLTLALLHFRVWLGRRGERASLLFAVAATATAAVALLELAIARAETTAEYAALVRWALAPLWFLTVALIGFVRVFFGTGRSWLALGSIALWTVTVIYNFLPGQNLIYQTMTGLRPVAFGGAHFVVGEGVANPWNAVNYLGTLLMLAFVVDASIALWRQGGRRRAVVVGGGVVFFFLIAGVHSALIEAGLIRSPYMISFSFLGVVLAMSSELSRDLLRAAEVNRQLQQSEVEVAQQRMELAHLTRVNTLSELSGSLAHELNQPLGIILSNAQAAQDLVAQDPAGSVEMSEILADIVAADRRAGEVIQRLRNLLKRGETVLLPLALNGVIEEVLRLTRAELIGRGVTVDQELTPDLPHVTGDYVQLQQVVLNLIVNAADAMSANAPGTRRLHVTTTLHQDMVRASVRDEGGGLPADIESLFQAFFTTKPHGLGMGLAICRSIITMHRGRLWAEPHPERGAVFHFEMPIAGPPDHA